MEGGSRHSRSTVGSGERVSDNWVSAFHCKGIRFASDKLSIEMLRQRFPNSFDEPQSPGSVLDQPRFFHDDDQATRARSEVASLLGNERTIALCAFADLHGLEHPELFFPLAELKDELGSLYIKFGLARGSHEAAES